MDNEITEPHELINLPKGDTLDARQSTACILTAEGTLSREQIAQLAGYANADNLGKFLRSDKGRQGVLVASTQRHAGLVAEAMHTQALLLKAKSEKVRLDASEAILQRAERLGLLTGEGDEGDPGAAKGQGREVRVNINLGTLGDAARVIEGDTQ